MKFFNYIKFVTGNSILWAMGKLHSIIVNDTIGNYCVTVQDGEKLREAIEKHLSGNSLIVVNFKKTSIFASPFFRTAFAKLFQELDPEAFSNKIRIINLPSTGEKLLNRIKDNISGNLSDPAHSQKMNDILYEELAEI